MLKNKIIASAGLASLLLSALPILAATTTGTQPVSSQALTATTLACVQTAVDAREASIGTAFSTFSTTESAALAARATALHTAWSITDTKARKAARATAWSTFSTANKNAYTALRMARKTAWSTFATASKACHVPVVESSSAEGVGSLGL